MQLATSAAAVPTLAFLSPTPAAAAPANRSTWDAAVDALKRAEEEYRHLDALHTAAFDAAEAECPRRDEFSRRYDLGFYEDKEIGRQRNIKSAQVSIVIERTSAKGGQLLSHPEAREARAEALRIVDEFDAWSAAREAAFARYNCDEMEKQFDAVVEKRYAAQTALLETPAPDLEALATKLQVLAVMMDGEQDQDHVALMRDDARRLLTITH